MGCGLRLDGPVEPEVWKGRRPRKEVCAGTRPGGCVSTRHTSEGGHGRWRALRVGMVKFISAWGNWNMYQKKEKKEMAIDG